MGVYGSVGHGAGVLPGVIEQLIAGEDAAGFFDENEQEFVFVGGEIEGCALELDAHGGGIVMEDGEVMWFASGCGEGIGAGEGMGDRETFGFQRIHQGIGDGRLVFYQQDS